MTPGRPFGFFIGLATYLLMSALASAQTIVIPTISVSEKYDSNVFFAPKSLLEPGSQPEDFITQVTPQMTIAHSGSLIRGNLSAGALITRYLHNPNLDFTGINVAGNLDVKNWADKLSQRISALSLNGTYQFTPSMTGFGATTGGLGTGFGSTAVTNPLNAGLITNRVSMHNYNLGVTGGYVLTRTTTLTGSYNYTKLTFGNQSGGVDNQLFDTTGHTAMTTVSTRLTERDTVGTSATMSHYDQGQSTGAGDSSFTTIGGTANWARLWTQRLNTAVSAGAIVSLPQETGIPGQTVKTQMIPTVTAAMNYTSFSEGLRTAGSVRGPFDGLPLLAGSLSPGGIAPPGQFTTSFVYSFSIFPSYAFDAGPIKTHVVGATVLGGITSKLSGQLGMNYSHGSSSAPLTKFDTVGLSAGARYLLGPVLASLTYDWLYFSTAASSSPGIQNETAFSKKMVMLSFSYAFTNQSFFRMGGFSNWGASSVGKGSIGPSGSEAGSGPSGGGAGSLKKE